MGPRILFSVLLSVAVFLAAYVGWWAGYRSNLEAVAERGTAQTDLVINRLLGQVESYRELPSVLSYHPELRAALNGNADLEHVSALLQRINDLTGALEIYLMDPTGLTIAASNAGDADSFVGQNFAFRPYFQRALGGALGIYSALGTTSGERGFFFASPVRADDSSVQGVIAVKADMEELETGWRGDPQVVFFTDSNDVVLVSNRQPLLFRSLAPLTPAFFERIEDSRRYAGMTPAQMPVYRAWSQLDRDVWELNLRDWSTVAGAQSWVLHLEEFVPQMDLTAHLLVDLTPARGAARLWALVSASAVMIFGMFMFILYQRRVSMVARLEMEASANARLETMVAERTEQLTQEVAERRAAEDALRRAQDDLVQAGKLSALGQISAGISHELNQPLMAIQSFARNAVLFMHKDRPDQVEGNLERISDLTDRMARIIKNLRAFARKEGEPVRDIDLGQVVSDTIELLQAQLNKAGVTLHYMPPVHSAIARGGVVRVQQVLINLMTNAAEAMGGCDTREIYLSIEETLGGYEIHVRDTGPGLAEPDHIFEPFYTTKSVDQGDGLGLGLSISYGIVQSFGGNIRGSNVESGGALMVVELPKGERDT